MSVAASEPGLIFAIALYATVLVVALGVKAVRAVAARAPWSEGGWE